MKIKQALCGFVAHRYDPEEIEMALLLALSTPDGVIHAPPECTRCGAPLPQRTHRVRQARRDYRFYTAAAGWFGASAVWSVPWEAPGWSIAWVAPILLAAFAAVSWQLTRIIGDAYGLTAREVGVRL